MWAMMMWPCQSAAPYTATEAVGSDAACEAAPSERHSGIIATADRDCHGDVAPSDVVKVTSGNPEVASNFQK